MPASSPPRRNTAPMPGASSLGPTRSARRCCRRSSTSSTATTPVHSVITQETDMKNTQRRVPWLAAAAGLFLMASSSPALASSHMDAPLITLDDAANTTDVYAFLSQRNGLNYLTTALAVYPHEEPGVGPNSTTSTTTCSIRFTWPREPTWQRVGRPTVISSGSRPGSETRRPSFSHISASSTTSGDAAQNLLQTYSVTRVNHRTGGDRASRRRHGATEQSRQRDAEVQPER